tara:strand:+ start:190 stop:453 length:264 start_codon:yes stop_codon:yes gene_type:complete
LRLNSNKFRLFRIIHINNAIKEAKKIDINIPSGPTHIPKGIINKKSPNPIGVFFEFLYLNHNLTNKYVEDKKVIEIAAPKKELRLLK